MSDDQIDTSIVTPVGSSGIIAGLFGSPGVQGFAARFAARFLRKPLRLGSRVVAAGHAHVRELLDRDLDFAIAAVNHRKIEEVNGGPFILGMDRSAVLERERRALYAALAEVDMERLKQEVESDIGGHLQPVEPGRRFDAVGDYARPIAARTAQRLFGITGPNLRTFMEVSRSIFGHTFLNLGDDPKVRDRGIRAGGMMQEWLAAEIARRRGTEDFGEDLMGALMRRKELDDVGIRRTLGGMLVGSVDTTASCVARILTVIKRRTPLRSQMQPDLDDLGRLYGWCLEALRVWPHNPIVLRQAASDTSLGGTDVKTGDSMVAFTHAAMQDPSVFVDPGRLRPDRDYSDYLHFGGGLHPCAGRAVNRFQIPLLVKGLLERRLSRIGRIGWAGGFPHRLEVTLESGAG